MRLRRAVFARVVTLVISLTVFIVGSFAYFSLELHRIETEKHYINRATMMGHQVKRLLLWDDRVGINSRLSNLVEIDDFISYAFVTVEGRPVAWTFAGGVPRGLMERSNLAQESSMWEFEDQQGHVLWDIAVPLDGLSGVLHLGLDDREINKALLPLLATISVLAAFAIGVGLFLAFVLSRRAIREVEALTRVVHSSVEGGDLQECTSNSTSLEVVNLASDFERMLSDRRRAETTISEQNQFLGDVFSALTHPFYVIDCENYRIQLANPAAQILGIEEGDTCFSATHGRSVSCDGKDHPCPLDMVKASGQAVKVEHVHRDRDGKRRIFEIHGFPVKDENDRVVQMIEYTIEITERREAEDALRHRNRELGLLNRVIGAAASGMDRNEILQTACDELRRAMDLDRVVALILEEGDSSALVVAEGLDGELVPMLGERVALKPEGFFREILVERRPVATAEISEDPRFEALMPFFAHFGIVSVLLVPMFFDGRVGGMIGLGGSSRREFSEDVVSLTRSVAAQLWTSLAFGKVNATRRRLQAVIEQTEDSVVITDTSGDIVYVNPGFERVTGYSEKEVLGENPRIFNSGKHGDDFFKELWSAVTEGRVWRGRIINKKKNSELITEDVVITPVRDEDGTITNFVSVRRDVTREIELEEQFLHAQKMEGIGRLAGGIAHDFNNLLGAIMGYAELTLAQIPKESSLRDSIDEIVTAAERAARLTRQLLIFSRGQPSEMGIVSLNQIVEGTEKLFGRLIGEDVEIETILDPDLSPVWGDSSRFEQVLLNLVVNAKDAMPGGGKLTIETSNLKAPGGGDRDHGRERMITSVCLSVTDTGTGMQDEVKDRIFEPFFSTKDRTKGTGLGLSTCYGIVTQSEGTIEAETAVGVGTTLRVILPACDPDLPPAKKGSKEGRQEVIDGSEVILLAEDDGVIRRLAAGTLRRLGYSVLEAVDGEDALAKARDFDGEIDLLVTDIVMPRLQGPDLAISLSRVIPDLKIVFISGYSDDPLSLGDFGDSVLLQKPFAPVDLVRQIRGVLDG